jgi:hypothetical protein
MVQFEPNTFMPPVTVPTATQNSESVLHFTGKSRISPVGGPMVSRLRRG